MKSVEMLTLLELECREGDTESRAFADGLRVAANLLGEDVEWRASRKEGTDLHASLAHVKTKYSSLVRLTIQTLIRQSR